MFAAQFSPEVVDAVSNYLTIVSRKCAEESGNLSFLVSIAFVVDQELDVLRKVGNAGLGNLRQRRIFIPKQFIAQVNNSLLLRQHLVVHVADVSVGEQRAAFRQPPLPAESAASRRLHVRSRPRHLPEQGAFGLRLLRRLRRRTGLLRGRCRLRAAHPLAGDAHLSGRIREVGHVLRQSLHHARQSGRPRLWGRRLRQVALRLRQPVRGLRQPLLALFLPDGTYDLRSPLGRPP